MFSLATFKDYLTFETLIKHGHEMFISMYVQLLHGNIHNIIYHGYVRELIKCISLVMVNAYMYVEAAYV